MRKYVVFLCFLMVLSGATAGVLLGTSSEGLASALLDASPDRTTGAVASWASDGLTSSNADSALPVSISNDVPNDVIGALLYRTYIRTLSTPMYYEETAFSSSLGNVQLTTRRVWQASAERFRVETTSETGRTILTIADGSQVWVIDTSTQAVLREQRADIPFRHLAMEPGDRGRVVHGMFADRPVHIVTLRKGRQTQTYTIDMETGILLKEEILGPDGRLVYMAYRSNLRLDVDFDPTLFIYHPSSDQQVMHDRNGWRTQRMVRDLSVKSGFAVHVPKQLPSGYELLDGGVHYVEDDTVVSLHFRKDTAVLSIFQQEHPITNGMIRQLLKRLTSTSSQELSAATTNLCGRSFLAIGPLTVRELERVLASIECM